MPRAACPQKPREKRCLLCPLPAPETTGKVPGAHHSGAGEPYTCTASACPQALNTSQGVPPISSLCPLITPLPPLCLTCAHRPPPPHSAVSPKPAPPPLYPPHVRPRPDLDHRVAPHCLATPGSCLQLLLHGVAGKPTLLPCQPVPGL